MSIEVISLVLGLIGAFSGALATYVYAKRMLNTEKITEVLGEFLTEISQNEDLQKRIYIVGALVGKGVKDGVGLQGGKGGKFKLEDLVGLAIQQFAPQIFGKIAGVQSQGQSQETQQTQDNNFGVGLIGTSS